jgi:sphingomyelin phosphodiesterase acid-like 3
MKKVWKIGKLCVPAPGCALATVFLGLAVLAPAQAAGENGAKTIQALFVSDIHLEPFLDPGKAVKLAAAPVGEWNAILAAPASADAAARWANVEQACPTRGADTSYVLYQSSLRAIHAQAGDAKFAIVSGDLVAHSFSCKFAAVFPKAAPADLRAFVEKTIAYVLAELRGALPGVPVYAALGNNDSDCGDYQLDANSAFLKESAEDFAADLHGTEQAQARETFAAGGYYSASLPAPLGKARLLVLDDLFMSEKYETCGGKADAAPAAAQIAWLKQQLDAAREKKEKVWVMAHIPPGVDSYSTARKWKELCSGGKPKMFLASEALPEALAEYGDVAPLAIFAHTHMDEVRLLEPGPGNERMAERGIAVKLVASISPIDGNLPSFTLASIDAGTAVMKDYRVIAASNATGVDTKWAEEYDFAQTYKEDGFTAISVRDVIAGFGADPEARQIASQSYLRYYMTGVDMRMMALIWQPYVCSLTNDTTDAYRECVCRSAP